MTWRKFRTSRWLGSLAALSLAVLVATTACADSHREFRVPNRSMEPTIAEGEYFSASPLSDPSALRIGDVVVFNDDRAGTQVKRVIATAGQRISFTEGFPTVDGVPAVVEPVEGNSTQFRETIGGRRYLVTLIDSGNVLRNTSEIVVPADHVFLVGDGRDMSNDSRRLGAIAWSAITHCAERIVRSDYPSRVGAEIR